MSAPGAPSVRLFLALWPTPPVRAALQQLQQRWHWPPSAALVAPERLHVTLHFLGQVPLARLAQLRDGLDVPFEPHTLDLAQARHTLWPGGLAVLELEAPRALASLHAHLAQALRALDWPVEARPFRPHVTFSRRAFGARPPAPPLHDAPAWTVDQGYALVRSIPSQGYEVLHVYGMH